MSARSVQRTASGADLCADHHRLRAVRSLPAALELTIALDLSLPFLPQLLELRLVGGGETSRADLVRRCDACSKADRMSASHNRSMRVKQEPMQRSSGQKQECERERKSAFRRVETVVAPVPVLMRVRKER